MKIIVGGPGTGKTESLLKEVERHLADGVSPDRIAYASFTRQAAYGAKNRAMEKFGFSEEMLPWFKTLHSMAYSHMDIGPDSVMQRKNYKELAKALGMTWTGNYDSTAGPAGSGAEADRCLAICEFARAKRISLGEALYTHACEPLRYNVARFADGLKEYKSDLGLIDFTEMVEEFISENLVVDVDVAFIDEAQDLTLLQWEMVNRAFRDADITAAGDDDQAIYRWSGADVDHFINLQGERVILRESHRLTESIFKLSVGVADRISNRIKKVWVPSKREGSVRWVPRPDSISLGEGTWLLLGRNRYGLGQWADIAQSQGVVYSYKGRSSIRKKDVAAIKTHQLLRTGSRVFGRDFSPVAKFCGSSEKIKESKEYGISDLPSDRVWYEAFVRMPQSDQEYLRLCLRNNENLEAEPRVRIDTIHGAKGAEADRVGLLTDISPRTMNSMVMNPDDEHRVFFVAASRASIELIIVMPQTQSHYIF